MAGPKLPTQDLGAAPPRTVAPIPGTGTPGAPVMVPGAIPMTPPPPVPKAPIIPETSRSGWTKQGMMRGSNKGTTPVQAPVLPVESVSPAPVNVMRMEEKNAIQAANQQAQAKERLGYEVADKLGKAAAAPAGKKGDAIREEARATLAMVADSGIDILELLEAFAAGFSGLQSQAIAKKVGAKEAAQREKEAEAQSARDLMTRKELQKEEAQTQKDIEQMRLNAQARQLSGLQYLGASPIDTAAIMAVQGKMGGVK